MKSSQNIFVTQIVLTLAAFALLDSFNVQAATWNGGGNGTEWSTSNANAAKGNWGGTAFNTNDNAIFGGTTGLGPTIGNTALTAGSITFNNTAGAFTIGGTAALTINGGVVNNDNSLQSFSVSTITLGASQTWDAGSVAGGGLAFSGSNLGLGANRTLTVSGTNNTSISNLIAGTGTSGVVKSGTGVLTLTNSNTYTGATTINAGTLKLDAAGSLASTSIVVGDTGSSGAILDATTRTGGFTVASGQTVSGVGTIQGSTTFQSGGNLTPGNSGAGIFSNLGNIALQSGSSFNLDITSAALGSGYDQLNVTGAVTLGGLLAVNMGAFVPSSGSLFFVLANDSTDAITGVFSNAPTNGGTYTLGGQQFQISYFGNHTGSGAGTFTGGNDVVLMAIPEPSASLLGGIGVLLLLRRRRSA